MNDLFEGFEGVKVEDTSASSGGDPFAGFEGVKIMTPSPTATAAATATASTDHAAKFAAMLGNPQGAERLQKLASDFGTTPDDPQFQARMQAPVDFRTATTLMQLADTGNPDEADAIDKNGKPTGLGIKAAISMFGSAGGAFRKRNDAVISRVAADQPLEVGDTRNPSEQTAMGMAGIPAMRSYKKIEDMTRAEQDASVPKEVLDIVNQNDDPTVPMDAATRAKSIYEVAKVGAMSREQMRRSASEELSIREELTGKAGGLLERAGVLAAKGMPTVGYGNTFLVGAAMGGIGALALPAVVSGTAHTSALLGADIDPDTGKVLKKGADYDEATVRGYAYGGFEAASEIYTGKVLGLGLKVLDKATGGYLGKAVSKGLDTAATQLAKTSVGRGIADFAKGVQRIAGLSAVNNPATEVLEEGVQQWDEKVFASRPSDNEVPTYAKNVLNEGTGQIEQVPVAPGSDEEAAAEREIARYGGKSSYVQTGTRQTSVGERTKEFNDRFYTWDNMGALAEGFALQYALTLGGGAMHAVQNRETSATVNKALLASGATNADLIRMSDKQKADAFNKFYGDESNRAEFAKTFKDAGDMLSASAQRMQEAGTWDKLGSGQKPTFEADIAKETEAGALKIDDEKSGLSVEHSIALEGESFTVSDRDGNLKPVTVGTAEEAQAAAERMSQLKQGREIDMAKRAEVAQNIANVYAPGRNLILVQNDADMQRAAADEGVDPAQYSPGQKGLTTPNGAIVVNVAAATGFDDIVSTIKHETGHSVGDESGLNSLMKGKSAGAIGQELQKAGILPKGVETTTAFRKDVETVREKYAARGVKLTDAGAVEEVLSTMQEGMTPVFRKRFGDGLVNILSKKGATAENMADARRIVANIMHSGKAPEVSLYGGKDAWNTPAPAFTGDPLAQPAGKQAPAPAGQAQTPAPATATPPAAPAAEAPIAAPETYESVLALLKDNTERHLVAQQEKIAAAKANDKPALEAALKKIAIIKGEADELGDRAEALSPLKPKTVPNEEKPAAPKEKMVFKSEAEFTDYATAHPEETAQWTDSDFEIAPNPEPAKSDAAQISPASEAGRGEALPEPAKEKPALILDGGKPSDIETDKAKTAAQRKKQEERDEIAKKAAAPLEGGMGDTTPPLPGMEEAAPDDLALLNHKPKKEEVQNADQERGAEKVAGGEQARGVEKDGGGDSQGSEAAREGRGAEAGDIAGSDLALSPQVAEKNAEVEFENTPDRNQYAEIPGVSDARGKRMYLIQGKWGNGTNFHVSPTHTGRVLNGMAVLLRTKGQPDKVSGVKILGGVAAPAGSEKWGVGQWATHNQKLVNSYEEGAKAASKAPATPKSDTKVPEAVKAEVPKVEPKQKMRFASEDEMMRYVTAHPEETGNWTGDEFEIVPGETAAVSVPEADTNPTVSVVEEFVPPKKQLGEPKIKYNQRVAAARMEWDAAHAEKVESPVAETEKAAPVNAKDTEEIAELRANAETQARVRALPREVYTAAPALAAMDAELPAYEARKASSTRTADSKERQAYSTPPPLAAIGAEAARNAATIIEPTAGNGGMLAPLRNAWEKPLRILANELDPDRAKRLDGFLGQTMKQSRPAQVGDYAAPKFQTEVLRVAADGKRAFLMNPPFGPTDESGYKLEHKIALKTIESAKPGDTLFFIGAAPGRDAMTMLPGALAGAYTSGPFAKFHSALNAQGWKAQLHFIADGALYRKMGASFPVEVLLMEKTNGKTMNSHMPMRDLPARYSTWEQIRAAVADMYDPGAATSGERVANALAVLGEDEKARTEAGGNAEASSQDINAARVKEAAPDGTPRYKLSQDIELGLVTPDTSLTLNPFMLGINAKVWDKEFAGKVHNPTQLAESILSMPPEIEEARIKVADAIAKHLESNIENAFHTDLNYVSMGPALREAFEARWNATRPSDVEEEADRAQVNYHPLSNVDVASPMKMPVELAGGMSTALDAFGDRHPDGIDAFVAERLHWTPAQEADGRLDGSQIDTLGLAIEKIDDGTGFIVGSQTGSGKGRVMASVMDYHVKNGRIPIFLTAQAKLFTDIWGDITAVGAKDNIRPLVLNDYKAPKADADGEEDDEDAFTMPVFYAPVQRAAALSEGKLPKGANAIFLTYSQVQNPTESTRRKIALIESLLASGKGALVMDEAHLAAGADSNRGAILRHLTDIAKPGVVFSSATFAKRGENMALYKRAGYAQFFKNDGEMEQALVVGGVPFQQYLAARLTERGFYIRHELDYEGVKFDKLTTIDTLGTPQERTALSQREEQIADVYNQVVRTVMRFGATVKAINSQLQRGTPGANMDGAAFMSSLHNTASFIYTALKAETVANAAVKALREGRAPVVTLYNTNQSLLTEIGIGQNADVGRYLTRIAQRAVSIQMPDGSSASILTPTGYAQLVALVKEQDAAMLQNTAHSLVRQAESAADYLREQNLPASPIDRVRETVEKAGFNFAEVTGRTLMVQNGVVVRRIKPNPDTVIHAFNNSLTPDGMPNTVLLLNSSGATGLSAHASAAFKNQARREMQILQPSWDINEMMQMFGRVNRKAQVSKPIYHLVFTSAAGEQRNAAILMAKLRSLSANTSGVSKAGYGETSEDALDFMNAFGDKALAELTKEKNPVVASIDALRPSTAIRAATSISQFLPVREQEEFIGQIQAKVAALQENAREAGLHDLEASDIGRVPLTSEQLLSNAAMRAYNVPVVGRGKILTAAEADIIAMAWKEKHPTLLADARAKIVVASGATSNPWLRRIYGETAQVLEHAVDSVGGVFKGQADDRSNRWFIPLEIKLPPAGTAQTASDWRVKVSFNNIRGVTTIPLSIFADKVLANATRASAYGYNENLTRKEDRTLIAGDVAKALIGNIVASGSNGASQIVLARPADGNFASFVLMMPRGVTVSSAKRIASSRLEPVTDVRDILPVSKNGWLEIDAGRVRVTPTYNSVSGDINGAVFGFRLATPNKARSKGIRVAQIMRTAGAESRLKDAADSQGYVTGQYLSVEEANKALADLAKLSPYLQATQVISDEKKVGGQDAAPAQPPRYRLADSSPRYRLAEPVFFSQLRRTLEAKMSNRMTVMALRGLIDPSKGGGIKADEIEWTGLKDFLDSKNPGDFVTKVEVLATLKDVEIVEVLKGQTQAELDSQEELTALARLGRDRTPEQEARYEYLGRRSRVAKDNGNATKFESYQLAGGENYRELLLTLPGEGDMKAVPHPTRPGKFALRKADGSYVSNSAGLPTMWDYAEDAVTYGVPAHRSEKTFTSSHFSEPNILAHVRFNERQAANGDKTLFLEEVQSDWHQAGREKGYMSDTLPAGWEVRAAPSLAQRVGNMWAVYDTEGRVVAGAVTKEGAVQIALRGLPGVPDAPFKDTSKGWARLAMKRMVRWAAENGFDRIAWTTGEQQAARYDLSKKIERVSYNNLTGQLMAWEVGTYGDPGRLPVLRETVPIEKSADYVGKEAAQKLIAAAPVNDVRSISGDDLRVGGEGMRTFYDQILPSIANDLGKRYGARVEDTTVKAPADGEVRWTEGADGEQRVEWGSESRTFTDEKEAKAFVDSLRAGDTTVHSLPVTPAMRDSVMQGQPRYRLSDPVLIGELRTQSQLENAAEPGFRILEHIRGSKIVVPWNFREKGEYDWYKEMGEYTGFTKIYSMETWNAMIKRPDVANPKAHGNMDTLAKELGYGDVNEFAAAFLAELDRSKAMYEEQKARREHRQGMIRAATESSLFKGKNDISEVMGKAVEAVAQSLPADEKETIAQIETHEGEEAVRDYILRQYQEPVFLDMVERYALDGRNDDRLDNIQLDDNYDRPEVVDKEGNTKQTIQQTHARLNEVGATLPMVQPQKLPSETEDQWTDYVRNAMAEKNGDLRLRKEAEEMIRLRLTNRRGTALTPEENGVMLWYFNDLNNQRRQQEKDSADAARENNAAMMNLLDTEADIIQKKTIDYINAKFTYGSLAGKSLRALQMRVDAGFNIVKIYHQAMEESGGHISAERFRALQERVKRLEKAWADYVDALEMPDEEKGLAEKIADLEAKLADLNANHDALKTESAELAKKRTALEAEHAKQSADANALSEKKAQLQAKIDNLESEIAFRSSLNQDIKALQAKVDELTKRMAALDAEYAGATPEFLAELEAQLADLAKQYAEKQAKYEKAQEALKTALERLARVRKMLEKLPKKISGTLARRRAVLTEAANLYGVFKAEMEKAQVERLANRWRGSNPIDRAKITIAVTRDMIRGLQSMGDESVAGRQLAKLGLAHPILWARAFAQSQHLVFSRSGAVGADGHLLTWAERSDREMFELDQLMREHPLFDVLVRKGGLSWMDLTADPQSFDEQQTPIGALLRAALPRWTGVGAYTALLDVSNNHYAGMSNMLRFAAAAQLYEKMNVAKGETPTDSDVHAIVGIVDIFGGRGDSSSKEAKNFLAAAGHFMYSPRLALSNVQFFTRMAGIAGLNTEYGARARAMMATEYLRLGAMYATISILARMISKMFSDDPDEQRFQFKPGHTAFLQIMMGQRRLDFTGGAAMWARSVSQILGLGDKLSIETGMVLQGEDARQNLDDSAVMRLLRSKLDPWTGMLWDVIKGKTYNGQAAGPRAKPNFPDYGMRYPNMLTGIAPVPLTFQSMVDLLRGDVEQGIAPLHNPLLILDSLGAQFLGTGANSLPINSEIAQEVADGNLRNAQKLEALKRQQQEILSDKKKSPEFKELRAQRIQDKLDALRGL